MSDRSIIESIQAITGTRLSDKVYIAACTVDSVDVPSRSCICTLIDGKADNQVQALLMADIDDGLLILPVLDSTVYVVFSDFVKPFVCQFSEIDQIVFNGGDLGGMVKVVELTSRINALENLLNDLIAKFNTHVHPGVTTGPGSSLVTTMQETQTATITNRDQIENKKFLQG